MNHENHTVSLENETVGTISRNSIDYQEIHTIMSDVMAVEFYDENGELRRQVGKMADVLKVVYLD